MNSYINIFEKKRDTGKSVSMITCYDYSTAKLVEKAGIDSILVGDSLGMVFQGNNNTLSVTVDDIVYHCKAVKKGAPDIFTVADMPYLSYHINKEETVKNAGRLIREGNAEAVKVEGGSEIIDNIKALITAKIPVMGHLGLTPQSINVFGGFKVQGKSFESAKRIIDDALLLEKSGVFAIVLECIPARLAELITRFLDIPTIGIGSGSDTDGQVLVINDAVGIFSDFVPKFVKNFCNAGDVIIEGLKNYKTEINNSSFPAEQNSYKFSDEVYNKLEGEYK